MKCYYQELCIERDAKDGEIKSAYRKLALKWHPDKNPDSMDVAKERFQLIQQAYEVLSDPQERAWYDNHREQILRGKNSEYEDNCLDVFPYFTVSCFKGYGDDAKGFYTIYRDVFEKIAAEDAEFMEYEEELVNIPMFGDSESSYEHIVGPFYAHWSAYCTKRTYTWLCPYDIREIKDRKIIREIEKDMKKVVQKAKKGRNEEIRNLVSFIRKRDRRVQAYKRMLEERSALNRQKHERNRLEQIRRRQRELEEMQQNSQMANNEDYEEKLKLLEQQYSSEDEYYEEDELVHQQDSADEIYIDELYCVACNKEFKTEKAFANHELSRKHRDNTEKLRTEMQGEEILYHHNGNTQNAEAAVLDISDKEDEKNNFLKSGECHNKNKTKQKKDSKNVKHTFLSNSDEKLSEENVEEVSEKFDFLNVGKKDEDWEDTHKKSAKKSKSRNKACNNKSLLKEQPVKTEIETKNVNKSGCEMVPENTQHLCATCKLKFESKNKLFSHLKLTNHGVFIPKLNVTNYENTKSKKTKGKRNN